MRFSVKPSDASSVQVANTVIFSLKHLTPIKVKQDLCITNSAHWTDVLRRERVIKSHSVRVSILTCIMCELVTKRV